MSPPEGWVEYYRRRRADASWPDYVHRLGAEVHLQLARATWHVGQFDTLGELAKWANSIADTYDRLATLEALARILTREGVADGEYINDHLTVQVLGPAAHEVAPPLRIKSVHLDSPGWVEVIGALNPLRWIKEMVVGLKSEQVKLARIASDERKHAREIELLRELSRIESARGMYAETLANAEVIQRKFPRMADQILGSTLYTAVSNLVESDPERIMEMTVLPLPAEAQGGGEGDTA